MMHDKKRVKNLEKTAKIKIDKFLNKKISIIKKAFCTYDTEMGKELLEHLLYDFWDLCV